jgi:hypothetical protein
MTDPESAPVSRPARGLRNPPPWFRVAFTAFAAAVFAWTVANLLWLPSNSTLSAVRLVLIVVVVVGYALGWQYQSPGARAAKVERLQRQDDRNERRTLDRDAGRKPRKPGK